VEDRSRDGGIEKAAMYLVYRSALDNAADSSGHMLKRVIRGCQHPTDDPAAQHQNSLRPPEGSYAPRPRISARDWATHDGVGMASRYFDMEREGREMIKIKWKQG
jgi:hypothetical protein